MTNTLTVFSAERFSGFSSLISIDRNDGKHIAFIDPDCINAVLDDTALNSDDKLAIEMVSNTINSTYEHLVQYAKNEEPMSELCLSYFSPPEDIAELFKSDNFIIPAGIRGSPVTAQTNNGSICLIVENAIFPEDYYYIHKNGNVINKANNAIPNILSKIPATHLYPIITLHEIIGHGRSLTLGFIDEEKQHECAILTENLFLRIMGYQNIQRDGSDHGGINKETTEEDRRKWIILNPTKQPQFK